MPAALETSKLVCKQLEKQEKKSRLAPTVEDLSTMYNMINNSHLLKNTKNFTNF